MASDSDAMSCYYPIPCWRSADINPSGKRGITFNLKKGLVDQPLSVPCGRCIGCKADRARDWGIRIKHEATTHFKNAFLTLTYSDPPPDKIDKTHLQDFIKSLRNDGYRFRYFGVGEYGSLTKRPHYHLIVFGQDFRKDSIDIDGENYMSPTVLEHWGRGNIQISEVNDARAFYVAGYCHKKIGDPDTFSIMSTRPGIGHEWLDKYHDDLRRLKAVPDKKFENPVPSRYLKWKETELQEVIDHRKKMINDMSYQKKWDRQCSLRGKELNAYGKRALKSETL